MTTATTADIVVLTALDVEFAAVRSHLTGVRRETHGAGTIFEVGTASGGTARVAVALTGAGNVGAAVLAERAIGTYRPRALFFVGVAGALADDVALGDVVVATKVYAYHGGREHDAGFAARPRAYEAPHRLEQLARAVARDGGWGRPGPAVHFRPIAAGEVVLGGRDGPLRRRLAAHYDDAAAVEMEGAGIAQAGHLNDAAAVMVVRGISDRADAGKYAADRSGSQSAAAARAARFAFALIAALPAGEAGPAAAGTLGLALDLLPADGPLDVRGLDDLADVLAGAGRRAALFGEGRPLVAGADEEQAWAWTADGASGLRADQGGARGLRYPLDAAAVEERALARWLSRALLVLISLPLPAPVRYTATVRVEATSPRTPTGTVAALSVSHEELAAGADEVAAALAARVVAALRG